MLQEPLPSVNSSVAVLFARSDSVYKSLPGCDVWDEFRNALNYSGYSPVVAHPPCRAWGRLKSFAKPREGEKDLAIFAVDSVRTFGGVLEHPAHSTLWKSVNLPRPGRGFDRFGGWSLSVNQFWFGHRAIKETWLYIVGVSPSCIPTIPLKLDCVPTTVERMGKRERESTPLLFAEWLLDLARRCGGFRA